MKICFISPFPPRADGISEFNQDLINGLKQIPDFSYFGIAINSTDEVLSDHYSSEVKMQIRKSILEDYKKAAEFINASDANIACLELEYALFGGFDGAYIKTLIKDLKKKLVVIVHGLPVNSYSRRKKIREQFFKEISPYVSTFITINPIQKSVLENWGLKNKVVNIYHGAPDEILQYDHTKSKQKLGLENKTIIFNFGLFHGKKGLEYLLQGFNDFQKTHSDYTLILAGEMLKTDKDQNYVKSLNEYISKHNLQNSVHLLNKFFHRNELYLYLAAADIFVTPYIKRDLVSSGPLSFAVLANKFIITTPFPYAQALLEPDEAYFVHYENSVHITKALNYYFFNKETLVKKMLSKLKPKGDSIKWSLTAMNYYKVFEDTA